MNSPLSRRDAIATTLLAGIISKDMTIGELSDAVLVATNTADELILGLDRTSPDPTVSSTQQMREALGHISDIMEEKANAGDDLEIGSTAFKSVRRWARVGRETPALPLCPEHLPKPPEDCVYWGNRPLEVEPETKDRHDVFLFAEDADEDGWGRGYTNFTYRPALHLALRRGSAIARANGIPD